TPEVPAAVRVRAALQRVIGLALGDLGRLDEARRHLDAAMETARSLGDLRAEGSTATHRGLVELDAGCLSEAERFLRQAVEADERTGPATALSAALANYGEALAALGDYEGAERFLRQGLTLRRVVGGSSGGITSALGVVRLLRGDRA